MREEGKEERLEGRRAEYINEGGKDKPEKERGGEDGGNEGGILIEGKKTEK